MKIHVLTALFLGLILLNSCNSTSDALSEWKEQTNFAIKDTASIDQFRISDTENNSITISRKEDGKTWKIDGSNYKAQTNNVKLILETFYRIKVKRDVSSSKMDNVIGSLSSRGKKVEIFRDNEQKPFKTWYIGGATMDHEGTFMLLQTGDEKSPVPFVMYKPGIHASMDVRFFTSWIDWRASYVFLYPDTRDIQFISLEFVQDSINSYKAVRGENNQVALYDGSNSNISNFDSSQVKHYFSHYKRIHFNKKIQESQDYVDSVFASKPFYKITLKDKAGIFTSVDVWKIKSQLTNSWDPEYGYIRINDENELFRIQYFSWDILFKPLSYFTLK